MKHKKSPSRRARHLRGYKSGNKIITYSDTKNNAPENTMLIFNRYKSGAFLHNTVGNLGRADERKK